MSNSDIVETIELTAKLLELHNEDEFKIKTYTNAAYNLDKYVGELAQLDFPQLTQIQGVGKMMAGKILEMVSTGQLRDLVELLAKTPEGVIEMFKIKGLGAKKIKVLWNELGIDNLNELQIACENGSIAKVKGFGGKTQDSILESLKFIQSQAGKLRMDKAAILAEIILEVIQNNFPKVEITGQIRRKTETVDTLTFLIAYEGNLPTFEMEGFEQDLKASSPFVWRGKYLENKILIEIRFVLESDFVAKQFIYSAHEDHLKKRNENGISLLNTAINIKEISTQEEAEVAIYEKFGVPYIIPEMREGLNEFEWVKKHSNDELVTWNSLKGILHNHSTYSDGQHSLEQMATYCKELGFEYLGIADHSQSATYANGLLITKILQQHAEIEQLNKKLSTDKPFKILKGIESDILGDGSLDYPDEILASFDYIVASVHSNLTMNQARATERLVRAIENPYTTILGHPTGRLLLSRQGYPIDYKEVIDCCAANGVVIEINASPYRLDLDWRWIEYALERNVMLSINPDAHEMQGYHDMNYGVAAARKGGLTANMTFNALSLVEMEAYLANRIQK
ncbi:PHP domain protein [Emticicia oligotrophica DSM 17448]|uniref:PHP domain protein n=1 Tax=Emticicia oligotrophica (strain DSM 17448 / CIP 109782 / MTCC 6937 / GPTSA100-15) TaxID=929562 RepID=A0ABM5N4W2_EMTOG|nr:PHP domain protein [Emticicia oligotrophica DSM 17448]